MSKTKRFPSFLFVTARLPDFLERKGGMQFWIKINKLNKNWDSL